MKSSSAIPTPETTDKTTYGIDAWQAHFAEIYGKKNSLLMRSRLERGAFLLKAVRYIHDCIRKKRDRHVLRKACASLFSRLMAFIDGFYAGFPFNETLCRKFPANKCGYCNSDPCTCASEARSENPCESVIDPAQLEWSISMWQQTLRQRYGAHNQAAGIEGVLNRLFSEVSEVAMLEIDATQPLNTSDDIADSYAQELADVFTWICAISSMLEIDLATAVDHFYGKGCLACGNKPCACRTLVALGLEKYHPRVEAVESMPAS